MTPAPRWCTRPAWSIRRRSRTLVQRVGVPVNLLALRRAPSVGEAEALGVRRISTGGGLVKAAYGALVAAARELQTAGTSTYLDAAITGRDLDAALRDARSLD